MSKTIKWADGPSVGCFVLGPFDPAAVTELWTANLTGPVLIDIIGPFPKPIAPVVNLFWRKAGTEIRGQLTLAAGKWTVGVRNRSAASPDAGKMKVVAAVAVPDDEDAAWFAKLADGEADFSHLKSYDLFASLAGQLDGVKIEPPPSIDPKWFTPKPVPEKSYAIVTTDAIVATEDAH